MVLVSRTYLDRVYAEHDDLGQAWLSSAICGAANFDQRQATYGLAPPIFLFVEVLLWFAQSTRAGAWTYFEATNRDRQKALLDLLMTDAPDGWAEHYAVGMERWAEAEQMRTLDRWLAERDRENTAFLWDHLSRHRRLVDELLT